MSKRGMLCLFLISLLSQAENLGWLHWPLIYFLKHNLGMGLHAPLQLDRGKGMAPHFLLGLCWDRTFCGGVWWARDETGSHSVAA